MTAVETPLAQQPLVLSAASADRDVVFPNRVFLAPMEGVTDRSFRSVVLDLGGVGGASTEFVRVSNGVVPAKVFRRELGPVRDDVPVAVQIMAAGTDHLAESVAHAEACGTPYIDLNFGCPVKRVFGKGAGSALLDDPETLAAIVRTTVDATSLPVSAKIRAGVKDDARLEDVLHAACEAGARLITLHARRRVDSYATPARWEWITQAAAVLTRDHPSVLLIGNGGVANEDDVHRMLRETGCDGVMIGRGALSNPFVFRSVQGSPRPTATEAAKFVLRYLHVMQPDLTGHHCLGRVKQLVKGFTAGNILTDDDRQTLLRARTAGDIAAYFEKYGTLD